MRCPKFQVMKHTTPHQREPDHMTDHPETIILEISLYGGVAVEVYATTDLEEPFYGYCTDTGDRLYFSTPWALDIEVQ